MRALCLALAVLFGSAVVSLAATVSLIATDDASVSNRIFANTNFSNGAVGLVSRPFFIFGISNGLVQFNLGSNTTFNNATFRIGLESHNR